MNNLRLCNCRLGTLFISTALLAGIVVEVKADIQYGPLKAGETLSSIVNENYFVSPIDDLVIMREIFRMNPQAFISNNMGLVKQGVTLTLPSDATLRRSEQQQPSSARVSRLSTPSNREVAQTLEATLRQARRDRDEAKQQLRLIEAESATQMESFGSRIKQLESDKQKITEQLAASSGELTKTKQSLEEAQQGTAQTLAKLERADTEAGNKITKQLEESSRALELKQQQVDELKSAISDLKGTAEDLRVSHSLALGNLQEKNKSLDEKLASLVETNASNTDSEQFEARIAELTLQHQQQLKQLQVSSDAKNTEQLVEGSNELTANSVDTNLTMDTSASIISTPLTKQYLIQRLEKPVAFPLWGLLLAAFALGFTSLMMLFIKRRRQTIHSVSTTAPGIASQSADKTTEEKLVFRADDPSVQDPNIETLRVPARRDPSRVAILDPAMNAADIIASKEFTSTYSQGSAAPVDDSVTDSVQEFDAKFKLLLAETYEELGDIAAANELLLEIQQEGNTNKKTVAPTSIACISRME